MANGEDVEVRPTARGWFGSTHPGCEPMSFHPFDGSFVMLQTRLSRATWIFLVGQDRGDLGETKMRARLSTG